jgi:hypothetical protein
MNLIVIFFYIVVIGILVMIALNITNIIQAGSRKPDGRTMAQILGVDPNDATYDDIEKLSRKEKMQLFYTAPAPDFNSLNGEYSARLLSGGVLGGSSAYFTHHIFPTGKLTLKTRWIGKAFKSEGKNEGTGYNIFTDPAGGKIKTLRIRKIKTTMAPTRIGKNGKLSFQIDYSDFNKGMIHSMRDEIRQINKSLFIGAGYMGLGGGPLNPAPFALIGPPEPWKGADE